MHQVMLKRITDRDSYSTNTLIQEIITGYTCLLYYQWSQNILSVWNLDIFQIFSPEKKISKQSIKKLKLANIRDIL